MTALGARALVALTAALGAAAVATLLWVNARLRDLGRGDLVEPAHVSVAFGVAMASAIAVGALLVLRRPDLRVGWDFGLLGAVLAATGALQGYGVLVVRAGEELPLGAEAASLSSATWVLFLLLLGRICLLTPTGRHLSSRWRWVAVALTGTGLLWYLVIQVTPGPLEEEPFIGVDNALGVDLPLAAASLLLGPLFSLLVVAAMSSLVVRFRRARGDERRQLLWVVVAALPLPLLLGVAWYASLTDSGPLLTIATAGFVLTIPAGAALAVLKVRLYEVDRILSSAAAWTCVTALLAGAYALVVVLASRLGGQAVDEAPWAVALATLVVVTAARPVHAAVQDVVDRRFARRRYDALAIVRAHVASPDPGRSIEQVLAAAVQADVEVAYRVEDRDLWVSASGRPATPEGVPVRRAGREVARVRTAAEPQLVAAVLEVAAPELANEGLRAAIAVQLEDVRASRARLASAQVDERRRVERDLHDGAQQRLLGLAATLQAALLNGSPERLREAVEAGVVQSRATVTELRDLANGLHPTVLDDGGLDAALADLGGRLPVVVRSALHGSRFAPAVESAAWFVVCESVANAMKHSGARSIVVEASQQEDLLRVAVDDDGRGGADSQGSGLRGLADRAEAAGGSLAVLDRRPGTRVEVLLPCGS